MIPPQLGLPFNSRQYHILLDGDLLIEVMYNRGDFAKELEHLLDTLTRLTNLEFYITDKALRSLEIEHLDPNVSKEAADYFRCLFDNKILTVTSSIIQQARELSIPDTDSAIEHVCVQEYGLDAIITQNQPNFPNASIPIWSIPSLEERITLENYLSIPIVENFIGLPEDCFFPKRFSLGEIALRPGGAIVKQSSGTIVQASKQQLLKRLINFLAVYVSGVEIRAIVGVQEVILECEVMILNGTTFDCEIKIGAKSRS